MEIIDNEEPGPECEACGTVIRYIHVVTHPNHRDMEVGCVCAEHLVEGYDGKGGEKALKARKAAERRAQRKLEALKQKLRGMVAPVPTWRQSRSGGWFWKRKGMLVVLSPEGDRWRVSHKLPTTNWHQWGSEATLEEAALLARRNLLLEAQIQTLIRQGYTATEAEKLVESL